MVEKQVAQAIEVGKMSSKINGKIIEGEFKDQNVELFGDADGMVIGCVLQLQALTSEEVAMFEVSGFDNDGLVLLTPFFGSLDDFHRRP